MIKIQHGCFRTTGYDMSSKLNILSIDPIKAPEKSGIYRIYNIQNDASYIGQSINLLHRLSGHRSLLKHNKHFYKDKKTPTLLQKAWNKYGEQNFEFQILALLDFADLNEAEKFFIRYFGGSKIRKDGHCYNLTDGGQDKFANGDPDKMITVDRNGEHLKVLISDMNDYFSQGYALSRYSAEKLVRMGLMQKPPRKRRKPASPETLKKMSDARKKRGNSEETKKKISKSMRGRKLSPESILRSKIAKYKPVLQFDKNNVFLAEHKSAVEAQKNTGVLRSGISNCCKSRRSLAGNFMWRFKNDPSVH